MSDGAALAVQVHACLAAEMRYVWTKGRPAARSRMPNVCLSLRGVQWGGGPAEERLVDTSVQDSRHSDGAWLVSSRAMEFICAKNTPGLSNRR